MSVLICTYNRAAMLHNALRSVLAQEMLLGTDFEVVVVDDGSIDDTADVVEKISRDCRTPLRYVPISHSGVATARNTGVAAARGDWIAFLDDDELASPDWLAKLMAAALAHDADCVGGRNELAVIEPPPFELVETIRKLLGDNGFMAATSRATINPGCGNALIKRALFARLDWFDPALSYGEDTEFFRRARRAGARIVFAGNARIAHLVPSHRLEASYLFAIAKMGATRHVSEDFKDAGATGLFLNCVLRLLHLLLAVLPRVALGWLAHNRGRLLGAQCSALFSLAYCVASGRLLLRRGC